MAEVTTDLELTKVNEIAREHDGDLSSDEASLNEDEPMLVQPMHDSREEVNQSNEAVHIEINNNDGREQENNVHREPNRGDNHRTWQERLSACRNEVPTWVKLCVAASLILAMIFTGVGIIAHYWAPKSSQVVESTNLTTIPEVTSVGLATEPTTKNDNFITFCLLRNDRTVHRCNATILDGCVRAVCESTTVQPGEKLMCDQRYDILLNYADHIDLVDDMFEEECP